jgi:hypothetical protein
MKKTKYNELIYKEHQKRKKIWNKHRIDILN